MSLGNAQHCNAVSMYIEHTKMNYPGELVVNSALVGVRDRG